MILFLTDGGDGASGYIYTDEVREKMRKIAIEKKSYLYFPIQKGESHPMFGKKHTKEALEKMSLSSSSRKYSTETIEKRACKLRGIPLTQEHKDKLSESNKGKIRSEETKSKISESKLGSTPHNKGKMKDIILQIDNNGIIIKEWYNLIDLEENGYTKSNIINVCMNKRMSHAGFIWKYKNEYEKNPS